MEASLAMLRGKERMDGDNQFFCEKCNAKKDAERFIELTKLPDTLCIQLMRFQYDAETGTKKKLRTKFSFPEAINMSSSVTSVRLRKHGHQ